MQTPFPGVHVRARTSTHGVAGTEHDTGVAFVATVLCPDDILLAAGIDPDGGVHHDASVGGRAVTSRVAGSGGVTQDRGSVGPKAVAPGRRVDRNVRRLGVFMDTTVFEAFGACIARDPAALGVAAARSIDPAGR
jgi:hypothetical protein